MTDPDGNEIKTKESIVIHTVTNKEGAQTGRISEDSFRIPTNGESGIWKIGVKSGSNFDSIEIEVLATIDEGIVISITDGIDIPTLGKTIQIKINGVYQTVEIEIVDINGKVIETLAFVASSQGEINQPWIIPKQTEPGIYTVKVKDAFNSAEKTFELLS